MSATRRIPRIVFRLGGKERSISWTVVLAALLGGLLGYFLSRSQPHRTNAWAPGVFTSPMAFCFYFWLVLSVYWSVQARKASAAKSAEPQWSRAVHLTLISAAQVVLFWFYPGWPGPDSPRFEFSRVLPDLPFLAPLGVVVTAGSLLLALWARRRLGRNWSGEVTVKVDHELVRSGPYRRIRHPIYTGAIGMYVGPALVSGRLQGIVALVLVAIAYTRKIRQEERVLLGEFGSAYDDYCRESWAVIP